MADRFRSCARSWADLDSDTSGSTQLISPTTRIPQRSQDGKTTSLHRVAVGSISSTVPTNSCPRTPRKRPPLYPRMSSRSVLQIPARWTLTRTSQGRRSGRGRSQTRTHPSSSKTQANIPGDWFHHHFIDPQDMIRRVGWLARAHREEFRFPSAFIHSLMTTSLDLAEINDAAHVFGFICLSVLGT
mmetsp:Transcript_3054/g.5867  ORF Transcript_3054/g.5867 Transcript_3054/m.5867 type:complete len:186 (-) Transcript_3054:474-1031(-)